MSAAALRAGQVIVVPTDTVYGLAAMPDNPAAVDGIYRAKGRPAAMHLPVLATSLDQVRQLAVEITPMVNALAAAWWPGPLTIVFGFAVGIVRPAWLAGRSEVAVRIPDEPFLLELLAVTGPLVVTSANQHGRATPPSAVAAAAELACPVELVVDGGARDGTPSTLVTLNGPEPAIEREGAIPAEAIASTLQSAGSDQ
jgi:L-threonylcarbamoyladenylate synthase